MDSKQIVISRVLYKFIISHIKEQNIDTKKMNKFVYSTLFLCLIIQLKTVSSKPHNCSKGSRHNCNSKMETAIRQGQMDPLKIVATRQGRQQCPGTICPNCPGACCQHPPGMLVDCCKDCSFCAPKGQCPNGPAKRSEGQKTKLQ